MAPSPGAGQGWHRVWEEPAFLGSLLGSPPASLSFSARTKREDSWLNVEKVRLANQEAESHLYEIILN